jgi:hypothetical protein
VTSSASIEERAALVRARLRDASAELSSATMDLRRLTDAVLLGNLTALGEGEGEEAAQ